MIKDVIFKPNIETVGYVTPTASIESIENEPMLFSASIRFAQERGGPLTKSMLDIILPRLDEHKNYVIDTKSVMLMPGMYPSIPGWHCDGVIRNDKFSQPDITKLKDTKHWTGLVSSNPNGTSNTEFLTESWAIPCEQDRVWGSVNDYLELMQKLKTLTAKDGEILEFTQPTLHRAMPTTNNGWRFFFRLSEYHMPPMNKMRHQVQVYASPSSGW